MVALAELKQRDDVVVILADQDGLITFANRASKELLGWEPHELVGQPITILIPHRLQDAHQLGFSRFLLTEKPTMLNQPIDLAVMSKDGLELNAEHVLMAERHGNDWLFGATIRPRNKPHD